MYELKKNGKVFTSKFVGTGPSSYEEIIYRAAVSQSLRNTDLDEPPLQATKNSFVFFSMLCSRPQNYHRRPEAGVHRSYFNPLLFTRTLVMTYFKEKLKSIIDKVSFSVRPFLRRNDECLPNRNITQVLPKQVSNNLISIGYQTQYG